MKFVKLKKRYQVVVSAAVLRTWKPSVGVPARIAHVTDGRLVWGETLCKTEGRVNMVIPISKPAADSLGLLICQSCKGRLKKRGDLP